MITAATRVSEALLQRPDLREILPAFHPAFARLNHPILGKVLPRLVSVADAARIAGVDVDALVELMNCPVGSAVPELPRVAPVEQPAPGWFVAGGAVLDVRPTLEAGRDPLAEILSALRSSVAGPLTVVAPFEPAPLVGLLTHQGWASWTRWVDGACHVTFARILDPIARSDADPGPEPIHAGEGYILDVRGLEPPQPMARVLAALDAQKLPLTVTFTREPVLLYARLEERGRRWTVVGRDPIVLAIV